MIEYRVNREKALAKMKTKAFNISKRLIHITYALLLSLASYQSPANDVTNLSPTSCYDNIGAMRYEIYPEVDLYKAPIDSIVGDVIVEGHIQCALTSAVTYVDMKQFMEGAEPWTSPSAIGAYELVMVSTNPYYVNYEWIPGMHWKQPSAGRAWYIDEVFSKPWAHIKKVQEIKPNQSFPNYTDNSGWYVRANIAYRTTTSGSSGSCGISCERRALTVPGEHLHEFVAVDESCEIWHPSQIPLPVMAKGQTIQANFTIDINCTDNTIDKNLEFAFDVISENTNYSADFFKSIHSGAGLPTVEMFIESRGSPVKFGESLILNVDQSGLHQQENFTAKFKSVDGLGDYSYILNVWVSYN